jgi:dihydrofolate reductase
VRRIIASEFISADGYIAWTTGDMDWVTGTFNEEMGRYARELMASMDTILLGRVTYQIMANAWPNWTEEQSPGSDRMNQTPKVVLSKTLDAAPWGKYDPATVIGDGVERRVRELKQNRGKNIVIYGSAKTVQSLTQMGLIDEYHMLVHPVILGGGVPLFSGLDRPVNLKLVRTQTYSNGVDVLYYERRGAPQEDGDREA